MGSSSTHVVIMHCNKLSLNRLFTGLHSYRVRVYTGPDIAFISMFAALLDEQCTDGAQ